MNLDKLKDMARRHELREEWRKAIEIYQRALHELTEAGEPADPSLFNRIGDLSLKAGEATQALHAYERAADTYAEQGFFNNAIALCGKILRVDARRTDTYLRLGELHARKNVLAEAKRNLQEYADRVGPSQVPQAVQALQRLGERFGGSPDLRAFLGELLRLPKFAEAGGVSGSAEETAESRGNGAEPSAPPPPESTGGSGLVFLDTGVDVPPGIRHGGLGGHAESPRLADVTPMALEAERPPSIAPLPFIEPTAVSAEFESVPSLEVSGFEATVRAPTDLTVEVAPSLVEAPAPDVMTIPGLVAIEPFEARLAPSLEPLALESGVETDTLSLDWVDAEGPVPLSLEEPDADSGLLSLDMGAPAPPAGAPNPTGSVPFDAHEPLFDTLDVEMEAGHALALPEDLDTTEIDLEQELEILLANERWSDALRVLGALIDREPDGVARHQQRVEVAYRTGDRVQLIGAYLSLGQALERLGARENAMLVYSRVMDHDPGNPVATSALHALSSVITSGDAPSTVPAPAATPESSVERNDGFVDLAALILDPEPERDTRMRVEQAEPVGEEDVDFRETLEQFKQALEANVDVGDVQTHYDLGIAFKEMGLLDEAIAQFQKALRSPDGRLKSSEALGVAFFEKGRFGTAEAVLTRAIEALPGADDEKIALLYWLGRAIEAQGRPQESLRWYERALAVDITFLDLSDRIQRLTPGTTE